ncbi:MAG: hypothetical protein AB1428_10855 [Bacteroidota bacterium]
MTRRVLLMVVLGAALDETVVSQISRWMTFEANVEFSGRARNGAEWNFWRATIVDADGKVRYVLEKRVPFDVPPPSIAVTDEGGGSVVIQSFEGVLEFYDGAGRLLREWHPFRSPRPDYERTIQCSVAGGKAAFLIAEPGEQHARVVVCGSGGGHLWERSMPLAAGAGIVLADSGNLVLACAYAVAEKMQAASLFFDAAGDEVQQVAEFFTRADISPDGKRFVMVNRRRVTAGGVGDSSRVRSWQLQDTTRVISSVCYTAGGIALVAERYEVGDAGVRFREPVVMEYSVDGILQGQTQFPGSSPHPTVLHRTGRGLLLSREDNRVTQEFPLSK